VPQEVLKKLEPLKNKGFATREDLKREVAKLLDRAEVVQFRQLILNQASSDRGIAGIFDPCLGFIGMLIGALVGGVIAAIGGAVAGAMLGAGVAGAATRRKADNPVDRPAQAFLSDNPAGSPADGGDSIDKEEGDRGRIKRRP
jgi:hypothetical protein